MDIPDWLWQELAADAIWTGIAFSTAWALKNRRKILAKLQPVTIPMKAVNLNANAHKVTVGDKLGITDNALITVGKSIDLRWRVEAPTPSLARRLEELVSWYLHVT